MTGPIMKKIVFESITDAGPSSSICQIPQPKKNRNCLLKNTIDLKKLQESELEQLSESNPLKVKRKKI